MNVTDKAESHALIANDIKVLVAELNAAIKKAAEARLSIRVDVSHLLDVKGPATYYPVVSARILAEIE